MVGFFYRLFIYSSCGSNYQEVRVRMSIGLTPPHGFSWPKPRPGFPMSYDVIVLMFNELRYEVIVHFVDIGGIFYHYFLNFLFIIHIDTHHE